MALANYLKVLRALQRSEDVKRDLSYCQSREGCLCTAGELCQRALAIATGLSDNAVKNMLLRLETYREELGEEFPFEIRKISGGGNYPRKFLRLRN
jgi:hypothetical protein